MVVKPAQFAKRRTQDHSSRNEVHEANSRIHFYGPQNKYRYNETTLHRTNHEFYGLTELMRSATLFKWLHYDFGELCASRLLPIVQNMQPGCRHLREHSKWRLERIWRFQWCRITVTNIWEGTINNLFWSFCTSLNLPLFIAVFVKFLLI
jgi:hypothetical protein